MNLAELKALAKAARDKHQDLVVEIHRMGDFNKAANPDTVLKLLTAIEKMRETLLFAVQNPPMIGELRALGMTLQMYELWNEKVIDTLTEVDELLK